MSAMKLGSVRSFIAMVAAALGFCQVPAFPAADSELSRLAEEAFAGALKKQGMPGGVMVIVQDGAVTLARGFGYADLDRQTPVDPERTLFYLASVTKCFTATAVMQQVEQGRLDLERDVNDYLEEFKVPSSYPAPVTLRHLLTHTAGFDDSNIGYVASDASEVLPLREYLRRALPARVMAPGRYISYSNHGFGLSGHLVEVASGQEFSDYLEKNIFRVLGMDNSSAFTPPPPALATHTATLYFYNAWARRYEPAAPGYRNIPPAGTVWATGADMGRFLLAHLQGGATESRRILAAETISRMHARQFSHHPRLPGFAFGFYEGFHAGVRILEHAGGYVGAATLIALVPEKNLGVFMAANQNTPAPHYAALQAILNHLHPVTDRPKTAGPQASAEWPARAYRLEGSYQNARYSRRSIEKIAILDSQIQVTATRDGYLTLRPRNGQETKWAEMEPLLFRRIDSDDMLSFAEDSAGGITHMFMSLPGSALPSALEKLSWRDSLSVQLAFFAASGAVFISSFTLWPLVTFLRWIYRWLRRMPKPAPAAARLPAVAAGVTGVLAVLFFAGLDQWLGNSQYRLRMVYGMPWEMVALLWIPIVVAALACLLAWVAVDSWRRRCWGVTTRIYFTLVAATALLFVAFLWNWNLLGFQY
ncbi:MAG: beta-lactamase family protein [Acidobacteria bacterium]|nr:beta-lactamase family protein [Acidobacteriota bacterium]